jgi:hypothetical protein
LSRKKQKTLFSSTVTLRDAPDAKRRFLCGEGEELFFYESFHQEGRYVQAVVDLGDGIALFPQSGRRVLRQGNCRFLRNLDHAVCCLPNDGLQKGNQLLENFLLEHGKVGGQLSPIAEDDVLPG